MLPLLLPRFGRLGSHSFGGRGYGSCLPFRFGRPSPSGASGAAADGTMLKDAVRYRKATAGGLDGWAWNGIKALLLSRFS